MGRWNSRYKKHEAVTPNRAKILFGLTNYGLQTNMWPSFAKSPIKGLANYDFRFTDTSLQDEPAGAASYESDPLPSSAAPGSLNDPFHQPLPAAVRDSNQAMNQSRKCMNTQWTSRRGCWLTLRCGGSCTPFIRSRKTSIHSSVNTSTTITRKRRPRNCWSRFRTVSCRRSWLGSRASFLGVATLKYCDCLGGARTESQRKEDEETAKIFFDWLGPSRAQFDSA